MIYLAPQGTVFHQSMARELAKEEDLIFLCGHYEGIDERVLEEIVTDNISIGDYVLTGGELPALDAQNAIAHHIGAGVNSYDNAVEVVQFRHYISIFCISVEKPATLVPNCRSISATRAAPVRRYHTSRASTLGA